MRKTKYTVKVVTYFMDGEVRTFENPTEYDTKLEAKAVIISQKKSIERNGLIERVEGMEYSIIATQYNYHSCDERDVLSREEYNIWSYHKLMKGGK